MTDIHKQMVQLQGNGFALTNNTDAVQFAPVTPRLLTTLLGATNQINQLNFNTSSFQYDEVTRKAQLPAGKSYSERGNDLEKEDARILQYVIGSKGTRLNAAPQDYVGRRKYGSQANEFMTEADVLAGLNITNSEAWELDMELGLAELLISDTNMTSGSGSPVYNFYSDIIGSARPADTDMDLGGGAIDHISAFRKQRKLLLNEVSKSGLTAAKVICICGDTFFNSRYEIEKQETLAREIRSTVDLASMPIPTISDGAFLYDNFESHDGILYINYGAEIIGGTKLIPDADARLIPLLSGDGLIKLGFAPSQSRSYVNTEAMQMYSWQFIDEFQGVTAFYERNMIQVLQRPKLVQHLTSST